MILLMALLNIARITFIANDPYFGSGLVAGDVINVYWESTTLEFSVTKNAANYPQAGSGTIAVTDDLAGRGFDLSYRTVTMLVPSYCVGTSLWTFGFRYPGGTLAGRGTNQWPYVASVEEPNSNVCSASPVVNDLAWSGPKPLRKHASTATSKDGEVTYLATSSNGQIYYALTASTEKLPAFSSNSGTFTGLSAGSYKIWARDGAGFMISYVFQILDMSAEPPPPPIETPSIYFSGSPSISQDTGPGDGAITYTALSNNPPIEYALRYFTYGDGNGQASSTFSNLRAGHYTLYAVDSVNALAAYGFDVPLNGAPTNTPATPPNFDIKYQMQVTDYNGKQSVVNILQNGYEGTVTQVDGGSEDPIVYSVRLYGNSDKYAPVLASTLTLTLNSATPFQFQELFTGSAEDYSILYYKEGVLKMAGRVYPQSYQEPYTEAINYPVSITATDGLVELDELDFVDDDGSYITGKASQIEVIALILQKLKFNIGIRVACNLYATGMSTGVSDDPLDQAYVDCRSYYQKDEPLSCLEVIQRILEPYCASVCQWEGFWWIVRFEEFVSTSVPYREFDYTGAYRANSTHNPVVNIKRTTEYNRLHWTGANMDMILPYGNIEVVYSQGLQKSLLRNGDFRITYNTDRAGNRTASVDLSAFNFVQATDTVMVAQFVKADQFGLFESQEDAFEYKNGAIEFTGTGKAYLFTELPNFSFYNSDTFTINIKLRLPSYQLDIPYQKVKLKVKHGSYYLQQDGSWSTTDSLIIHYVKEFGKNIELKTNARTDFGGGTATLTITVYSSYAWDPEFTSYANLRTKATVDLPVKWRTEMSTTTPSTVGNLLFYELEENTAAESTPDIVRPNDYNAVTNPVQWILKSSIESYITLSGSFPTSGQVVIDEVRLEYSPGGYGLNDEVVESLNPGSNKKTLTKTIYHGSAVKEIKTIFSGISIQGAVQLTELWVTNPNYVYTHINYLRSSAGVPFQKWSRDAVDEDHTLQQIVMRSYAAQYKRSSRRITGSLSNKPVGGDPVYLTPISMLKENYDGKFYKAQGFAYHDRICLYDGEFVEMVDITSGGVNSDGSISSFSTAFNSSFGS